MDRHLSYAGIIGPTPTHNGMFFQRYPIIIRQRYFPIVTSPHWLTAHWTPKSVFWIYCYSAIWRQTIIPYNPDSLLNGQFGTKFHEIWIKIQFSFKTIILWCCLQKYRPFCLGLNALKLVFTVWRFRSSIFKWPILRITYAYKGSQALQWRHNDRNGI